jgi:hypothetical protein
MNNYIPNVETFSLLNIQETFTMSVIEKDIEILVDEFG